MFAKRGWRGWAIGVAAIAFSAGAADPTAGERGPGDRQTVSSRATSPIPGGATGAELDIEFINPSDADAKPPVVRTLVLTLPEGSRIDTSVPTRCTASDAELVALGPSACPAESQVGEGRLTTDTGFGDEQSRFTVNRLITFNNTDEVINYSESQSPPTRVIGRSTIQGTTITTEFPSLPGGPPDFSLAYKRLRLSTARIAGTGGAYLRNPPSCPVSGHWKGSAELRYSDGVIQTVPTTMPCVRARPCTRALPGSKRGDRLHGSSDGDRIIGRRGADRIRGGLGDDCIRGGRGRDTLRGGGGDDRIAAGRGHDRVIGGPGDDRIAVRAGGSDRVRCGPGNDRVRASERDRVSGSCERVVIG